jgi:hypothetical protein
VVQAKDWSKPVTKGALVEFLGILRDLPGQPRGIFVSREGYQKGAKLWAAANGILLYTLTWSRIAAPTTVIVGGYVKMQLVLTVTKHNRALKIIPRAVFNPRYSDVVVHAKDDFADEFKRRVGCDLPRDFEGMTGVPAREIVLCDEHGATKYSLQDIYLKFAKEMREAGELRASKRIDFTDRLS